MFFFALIAAVVPFWQQMALRALFAETWWFLPVLFVWNKNTAIFFQIYEEKCKNIVKILLFWNTISIVYGIQVIFFQIIIKYLKIQMFLKSLFWYVWMNFTVFVGIEAFPFTIFQGANAAGFTKVNTPRQFSNDKNIQPGYDLRLETGGICKLRVKYGRAKRPALSSLTFSSGV